MWSHALPWQQDHEQSSEDSQQQLFSIYLVAAPSITEYTKKKLAYYHTQTEASFDDVAIDCGDAAIWEIEISQNWNHFSISADILLREISKSLTESYC